MKMTEEIKLEPIKYRDDALDYLNKLHDQLAKAIEARKKSAANASNSAVFNQAQDIANTVSNLEKIYLKTSFNKSVTLAAG